MGETIKDRSEILFIYEVRDANPNGDPLDENKPRVDPETGVALVTDVRIKRTVRDYWHGRKEMKILVHDTFSDDGFLNDGKGRCRMFFEAAEVATSDTIPAAQKKLAAAVTGDCIDARVFGATLPFQLTSTKKGSVTLTGPAQFSGFSRSLHRVSLQFVQGTAAYASKTGTVQKSFREEHLVHYACFACYGVVNEIAARHSGMTEADRALLLEGLWRGTEDLISRSKMGHRPLLLLDVRGRDGFRLGDLASRVRLVSELNDLKVRSVDDYELDVSSLWAALEANASRLEGVRWRCAPELRLTREGGWRGFDAPGVAFEELEL